MGKWVAYVPGRVEQDGGRFHHTSQNGMQFKTYELFVSGGLHLIFLDLGWPWALRPQKTKAQVGKDYYI